MITYDPVTKTVTMDWHDAQHCGFDWIEYITELEIAGIEDKAARAPHVIVINNSDTPDDQPGHPAMKE